MQTWDPKYWEQEVTIENGLELAVQCVADLRVDVDRAFLELFGRRLQGEEYKTLKEIILRLVTTCDVCDREFVFKGHETCPRCELVKEAARFN